MNRIIPRLLSVVIILSVGFTPITNAQLQDKESSEDNTFTAGCWAAPSVPAAVSPADQADISDTWVTFDWADSSFVCPGEDVTYQIEVYEDEALTGLNYQSGWLMSTDLTLPALSEGDYYWRVHARDSQGITSAFSPIRMFTISQTGQLLFSVSSSAILMSIPEPQPEISMDYREHRVRFGITHTQEYELLNYVLTYDSDSGVQGIQGRIGLTDQPAVEVTDLLLGTCSEKSCLYHTGMTNLHLEATLSGTRTTTLIKDLPL